MCIAVFLWIQSYARYIKARLCLALSWYNRPTRLSALSVNSVNIILQSFQCLNSRHEQVLPLRGITAYAAIFYLSMNTPGYSSAL